MIKAIMFIGHLKITLTSFGFSFFFLVPLSKMLSLPSSTIGSSFFANLDNITLITVMSTLTTRVRLTNWSSSLSMYFRGGLDCGSTVESHKNPVPSLFKNNVQVSLRELSANNSYKIPRVTLFNRLSTNTVPDNGSSDSTNTHMV